MATSLQRILVLTLAIYIVLTMAGMLYMRTNMMGVENEFTKQSSNMQNYSKDYYDQYSKNTPDVNGVYLDKTAGDSKYGGKSWIQIFLDPALGTMSAPDGADWLEIRLTNMVNWVIHIIQMLLGLEVFLILYSKKTS